MSIRDRLAATCYYLGRIGQLIGMWLLVVDVFMAGPMGPQPNPFYVGVALFLVGWFMVRQTAAR